MARQGRRQTDARRPARRDQGRPRAPKDVISCSPAPCARWRQRSSVAGSRPRCARSSRSSRCSCARSTPGCARTRPAARPTGPNSSSAWTASRRSSPRPRCATPALLALLSEDAVVSDAAKSLKREMLARRYRAAPEEVAPPEPTTASASAERRVVPQSVVSRQLANPFLAPDFSAARPRPGRPAPPGRLGAAQPAAPLVRTGRRAARRRAWRCPNRRTLRVPGEPAS